MGSEMCIRDRSYIEPIINEAAEKTVQEYRNSNPLAERIIEVEKIVEVPVEKIVEVEKVVEIFVEKGEIPTPTPTPIPIIRKTKAEISQYWECKVTDNACNIALGNSDDSFVVTDNKAYEVELFFTSGYEPSELNVSIDFCYPSLTKCWLENGHDGYGSLIAQPELNDYRYAEFKWVPAKDKLTWDGSVIMTSKIVLVTPKGYLFKKFDPVVTITDPEGKINTFNFKKWKSESLVD